MKKKTYARLNAILTLAGAIFSGYLSGVRLATDTCAFDEPCPLFLGYPACYFGFVLFTLLCLTSVLGLTGKISVQPMRYTLRAVSFWGVSFAGYFVIREVARFRTAGSINGTLVLPTCAYGLVFFLAIFTLSFRRASD